MIDALIILLVFFVFVNVFLVFKSSKIKQKNAENLEQLQGVIISLNKKHKFLNTKIEISAEFKMVYLKDVKTISNEIVELQKIFIDLLN